MITATTFSSIELPILKAQIFNRPTKLGQKFPNLQKNGNSSITIQTKRLEFLQEDLVGEFGKEKKGEVFEKI